MWNWFVFVALSVWCLEAGYRTLSCATMMLARATKTQEH